ncbi:MAG: rRNA pseudouridine synthase [Pirellulales bacterium]|nr:rRNA pseudouridine synthase [Pirellulales bacterium]
MPPSEPSRAKRRPRGKPSGKPAKFRRGKPGSAPRKRPAAGASSASPRDDSPERRLQQVLAAAGVGSRRHCEELILAGRVEVDGEAVTKLGTKVDPARQQIRLDGEVLVAERKSYFAVHKPVGIVSTNHDPSGRPRVIDLLPPSVGRVYTVGRLDKSSEGLILVTNDGELAERLTHPRYGVAKTYHVLVAGQISPEELARLQRGIHLAEGFAKVEGARIKKAQKQSSLLEIVLREGRNREIRRLLARAGHKVLRLKRIAIANLRLADLPSGAYRMLRADEVRDLRRATFVGRPAAETTIEAVHESPSIQEEPALTTARPAKEAAPPGKPPRQRPHAGGPRQRPAGRGKKPFERGGQRAERPPRKRGGPPKKPLGATIIGGDEPEVPAATREGGRPARRPPRPKPRGRRA